MIPITDEQILRLAPRSVLVYRKAFGRADEVLAKYAINSNALRLAHFMAQQLHETGGLRVLEESLNYSADALLSLFRKRITPAVARKIGRTDSHPADQPAIAEALYGGEWGRKNLGNTQPGDGYRFRGRGPTQLTGRANYRKLGRRLGIDLEGNPELALDIRYVLEIPACYWFDRGCNAIADADDLKAVTKAINGGHMGLADRAAWLEKTRTVWAHAASPAKCVGAA